MEHDKLITVGVQSFGVRHKLIRGVANLPTQKPLTSMEAGQASKNESSLNPSFVALNNNVLKSGEVIF